MDNLTQEQRHKNMQHIKSKDSKIELTLRKALWKKNKVQKKLERVTGQARYCYYKV